MIDITVAWDKLSNFETADEIAIFFANEGIKGQVKETHTCAISKWLQSTTGDENIVTHANSIGTYLLTPDGYEFHSILHVHTPAMEDFVERFDYGYYPELIEECGCDGCKEAIG